MSRRQIEKLVAYSLLLIAIALGFYVAGKSTRSVANLIIGLLFGMIMSRTAFSFTGNLRSPILNKDYTYSKLFFLMTVITFVGINLVVIIGLMTGNFDYAAYLDKPTKVSVYFFFAAIVFGFGICLVGSAGSGIIRKVANAKFDFVVTLVFYVIGSVLGVAARNYALTYFKESSLYMPEMFGWPLAITIQVILLTICYLFLKKKGVDKNEK